MSNKEIYIAYVLLQDSWSKQLLRYEFEHPIVEFWAEPDEQSKLEEYFRNRTGIRDGEIVIKKSDVLSFYAYKQPSGDTRSA